MSSSEENYDLNEISSGEESEGYSPVSKKTVSVSWLVFHLVVIIHRPAEIRPRLHLPKPNLNLKRRPPQSLGQLPRKC